MEPKFFATSTAWREWLDKNHGDSKELLVGFYKKNSGKPSMSWPESVDEALCFGWIDGVRRRIDEESYTIRFTPRKLRSTWSAINIKRVDQLASQNLMRPAGIAAFEARQNERSAIYSFEQANVEFTSQQLAQFKANATAWSFFQRGPPYYRRLATWWVISAKRQETKDKRLAKLIEASAKHERIDWGFATKT